MQKNRFLNRAMIATFILQVLIPGAIRCLYAIHQAGLSMRDDLMYQTKVIAEALDVDRIWVESTLGRGSKFRFTANVQKPTAG